MKQPENTHLVELNIGRLVAETDDPRVAEFMNALDLINGLGKRSRGFVWMMEGSGEPGQGNTETKLNGDSRFVPNLTMWENAGYLHDFVFNTVHKQFFNRRAEWFEILAEMSFVMWFVPIGHIPTLDEALARLENLRKNGENNQAFGWKYLKDNEILRSENRAVAAE